MLRLVIARVWQGLIVLVVVSALVFALLSAAGGDALSGLRSNPLIPEATIEQLGRVYELDKPLPVRYVRWLTGALGGDLGYSFYYRAPVSRLLWPRLRRTLLLALVALVLAWTLSLLLGAWAARRQGSVIDRLSGLLVVVAASTPRLVLALAALLVAARTSLFSTGAAATDAAGGNLPARMALPAVVLAFPLVALFLAQTREGLGAALAEEFVQVARAKGLRERTVVVRHALRAALNPLITIAGYALGSALSGSVIVETVLGWPGLGELSVVAVRSRDVPLLLAVVSVAAASVLVGNLLADIALRLNDPRLRADEARRTRAVTARAQTPVA